MITAKGFKNLTTGDIVTHATGEAYTVLGRISETVLAIRYVTVTNPQEWTIFRKHQAHTVLQLSENRIKALELDRAMLIQVNSELQDALHKALNKKQ